MNLNPNKIHKRYSNHFQPSGKSVLRNVTFQCYKKLLQVSFYLISYIYTDLYYSAMKEEDAKYHLDRCIKSGLWCPGGDDEGNCFTL